MTDERPTCATCCYFDPAHAGHPQPNGLCRVSAPSTSGGKWPVVISRDWCGEHPAFHERTMTVTNNLVAPEPEGL